MTTKFQPTTDSVTVEVATTEETIRTCAIDDLIGLEHSAAAEACAAYRAAAVAALESDRRAGRLVVSGPRGQRILHSAWAGTRFAHSCGAIGTMAALTDDEQAALSAADDAGREAARKVAGTEDETEERRLRGERQDDYSRGGWRASHRITLDSGEVTTVMLVDDGAAYTFSEWDATAAADYERDAAGNWTFQGQPFAGRVDVIDA